MKKIILPLAVIFCILTITSCAPEAVTTKEYGFFYGLLHGFILPFAIIGKIFNLDIGIHAANNTGFWYWLGYFIGFVIITGGSGRASRKKKS